MHKLADCTILCGASSLKRIQRVLPESQAAKAEDKYRVLPSRSVEGLARSLMRLMGVALPVPDHTKRRGARSALTCSFRAGSDRGLHLMVDSTALKIYGEGEWRVRQQGAGSRLTWRKAHLAVDGNAKDVRSKVEPHTYFHGSPVSASYKAAASAMKPAIRAKAILAFSSSQSCEV